MPRNTSNHYDLIVIGSGIGGALMGGALTAAHLQGAFGFFGIVSAAKQAAARRRPSSANLSTALRGA